MQKERSCPFGKRVSMKRERLGSRMGFIMLSAGWAIGWEMYGNFRGCAVRTAEAASCWSISSV